MGPSQSKLTTTHTIDIFSFHQTTVTVTPIHILDPLDIHTNMEDPQHLLFMDTMERLLIQLEECDVEFCPPPVFDLPPPPPPPWLVGTDDEAALLPDCSRGFGGCSGVPTAVVSSVDNVQQIVQHISVIVVSSFIIVITVMLTAVIFWRRGRVLVRKFGSRSSVALHNHSHGSNGATSPSKHKAVAGSQRTLPNHYTTTSAGQFPIHNQHHQLGVDVNGRAVLATTIPTNNGTSSSAESSSLLIGGVPFHILQRPAPPLSGSCEAGRYGSALASLYPVYETIDYSDGSEKWSVYSSDRQLSATRCSPLSLVPGTSGQPGVSNSPSTTVGTDTPTPPPLSVEEDRLRHYSRPGSDLSGYLVYPVYPNNPTNGLHHPSVHAQYIHEAHLVHHPTLPVQQHQFVVGGVESVGTAARVVCAPRHLPNLPSATPRRTQSHRTSASTAVPITRTPLPPIPRTMQSTISLEATSETSSSPVTQL